MNFIPKYFRQCCSIHVFYITYTGKPEVEVSEFHVTGTDEYSLYLVDKLSGHVDITSRNVSMDRYFTSVTITHYLKEKKMTLVGTMSANKKGIPKELVEMKIVMMRISSSFMQMKMI